MQLTPEVIAGFGAAFAIVVALLFIRARAKRSRGVQRPLSRGPASIRFVCAGCSEQFTHSKRTLGAWEKGTRRFYCNACHTKWRGSHAPHTVQRDGAANSDAQRASGRRAERPLPVGATSNQHAGAEPVRGGSGGGCLGAAVLLIAAPVAIVLVVVHYA